MRAKCFDEWQWSKLQTVLGHYLFCYRHWLFRSWGRIGTTIGGKKLDIQHNLQAAICHFEGTYFYKTGNYWSHRKNFRKVPGQFFPVDLDYNQVTFIVYVFDGLLILVTLKVAGVGTQSSKKFMHLLIML